MAEKTAHSDISWVDFQSYFSIKCVKMDIPLNFSKIQKDGHYAPDIGYLWTKYEKNRIYGFGDTAVDGHTQ